LQEANTPGCHSKNPGQAPKKYSLWLKQADENTSGAIVQPLSPKVMKVAQSTASFFTKAMRPAV